MTTMLADAEAYYAANRESVDAVVSELEAAGVEDGILDEVVHEMADDSGIDSEEASSLNNQGFAFQVASIFEGLGQDEGMARIRDEAGLSPKP